MEVFNQKWEKVYRWVLAYIDRNKFSGNLKLPSENDICRYLKVSRDTERLAKDETSGRRRSDPQSAGKRDVF